MQEYGFTEAQREQVVQWLSDAGGTELLSALSYNLRRVIQLRYGLADGHRYSVEETAKIFDKSINWVVEIESGALRQLYECLDPVGRTYTS